MPTGECGLPRAELNRGDADQATVGEERKQGMEVIYGKRDQTDAGVSA